MSDGLKEAPTPEEQALAWAAATVDLMRDLHSGIGHMEYAPWFEGKGMMQELVREVITLVGIEAVSTEGIPAEKAYPMGMTHGIMLGVLYCQHLQAGSS